MAAPTFIAASTGATDAGGTWSYTTHAPGAAGRLFIIQILQDGATTGAVAFGTPSNIELLDGSDNNFTIINEASIAVGGSSEARTWLLIGRSMSTTAITIGGTNSTSEDLYIRAYEFDNVATLASGADTLAEVIENGTAGSFATSVGTDGTITDAGVTTLGADRLALNFVAINDDNTIPAFTGETGGDWTLAVSPYAESSGTDGAIGLQAAYPALVSNETGSGSQAFGYTTVPRDRVAQSFASGAGGTITSLYVKVLKTGSPTDNAIFEIQTDSAGAPSGTVVGTGGTIAGTSLTTTATWYTVTVNATLSASTTYWVVMRRSGASEVSNYYRSQSSDANPYSGGEAAYYASGSWTAITGNDLCFGVATSAGGTINGGTATNSDATDAWGVVGFALIGTTVVDTTYYPRHPAHDFGSVTNF